MSEAALTSVVRCVGVRILPVGLALLLASGCGEGTKPAVPAATTETKPADLPIMKAAAKGKGKIKVTEEDTSAHLRRKNAQTAK